MTKNKYEKDSYNSRLIEKLCWLWTNENIIW